MLLLVVVRLGDVDADEEDEEGWILLEDRRGGGSRSLLDDDWSPNFLSIIFFDVLVLRLFAGVVCV